MRSTCRIPSRSRSILPVPRALAGMLSWHPCWMRLLSSRPTTAPTLTMTSWTRSALAWRRSPMRCCCVLPRHMQGGVRSGMHSAGAKDDDPVLVWRAPTRTMNPSVSQQVIDQAAERDPASAAAEWLAEFRSDIESFINREAVEACIAWNVRERAPMQGVLYHAFVDPSGGSADSTSLAVGHREDDVVVLDALREIKPPFSPESGVAEFSQLVKSYRVSRITGDRYA